MTLTFCDCCKKEFQRHAVPNPRYRTATGVLYQMCEGCGDKFEEKKLELDKFVEGLVDSTVEKFEAPVDTEDGTDEG